MVLLRAAFLFVSSCLWGAGGGCGAVLGGAFVLLVCGGARLRFGVGHGGFLAVGGRARCRVHCQHLAPLVVWGLCWGSALLPGVLVVCWGCWWLWWVVCDLYSGCEHLCCLRASPFFLLFVLRSRVGCVGGARPVGLLLLWWWVCGCVFVVWFCGAFGGCLGTKS